MAEYRPIKVKIWHDEWFVNLNPEERCFWFFLLTNEYVNFSGIYELPKPLLSPLSGCPKALEILQKFEEEGKIVYKNGFLFIKNYYKNQSKQFNKNDNITKSIIAYLSENNNLIELFNLRNEAPYKPLVSPLPDPPLKLKAKRVKGKVENPILQADACEVWDSNKYIEILLKDKQPHIRIIGYYWKIKDFTFPTKKIATIELKRDLKPASELIGWPEEKIYKVMDWLQEKVDFKWTIESISKYIKEFK